MEYYFARLFKHSFFHTPWMEITYTIEFLLFHFLSFVISLSCNSLQYFFIKKHFFSESGIVLFFFLLSYDLSHEA